LLNDKYLPEEGAFAIEPATDKRLFACIWLL